MKRPDMPGHREQVASRDRMLERHPGLRVVGCHLGSLEYDVREVATRLERFPSFAVDLSGRVCHLQVQQGGAVREFLVKYQDRILYGTDMGWHGGAATAPERAEYLRRMDTRYLADYRYFAGSGVVTRVTDWRMRKSQWLSSFGAGSFSRSSPTIRMASPASRRMSMPRK